MTANRTALGLAALVALHAGSAMATSTAFTYQGQLTDTGAPASGLYDFQFTLYTAVTGGTVAGSTVTVSSVPAAAGLFSTTVDFGSDPYEAGDTWLEIAVSPAGAGTFTTLSPRQPITPTPVALTARDGVKRTGDTMSGPLGLPSDGLSVGANELVTVGGNVGIGIAQPAAALHVFADGGNGAAIYIDDGSGTWYAISDYQGTFYIDEATRSGGSALLYYSPAQATLNVQPVVYLENGYTLSVFQLAGTFPLDSCDGVFLIDSTNSAITTTLPTGVRGAVCTIKHNKGANAVTLATSNGLIDGAATVSLTALNSFRQVVFDGTNWDVIAQ